MTNMVKRAFPGLDDKGRGLECIDDGMTLRDWFAGQALAGFLADTRYTPASTSKYQEWIDATAFRCYGFADAMMKARDAG